MNNIPWLGSGPLPDDVPYDLADMLSRGREFNAGHKRFRVQRVLRGSMSRVHGNVIPRIQEVKPGQWKLGLYAVPEYDPQSHLLVAFELQRTR